ncbi:hypothetical protein [Streptomyces cellostaticus]|uniref:hypothetical protein n=1 Tax=Streptomyces cellostaticus TaxID=67285 RepID=UPI002026D75B|nr:hypothetical protein [Streptomyces cellostaticus]
MSTPSAISFEFARIAVSAAAKEAKMPARWAGVCSPCAKNSSGSQAVADGRAADYRIVVPTLTDTDLRRRLNLPAPGTTPTGTAAREATDDGALRTTALHLAVLRTMTEHNLKKVLVYFHLVSDARRFARELPHTLRLLAKTDPGLAPG